MSQIDPRTLELLYQSALRPTWRTWTKHILLLLITFVTMTIAGTLWPFGLIPYLPEADPQSFGEVMQFIRNIPTAYLGVITGAVYQIWTNPVYLRYGLSFSISLLFILTSHEMGHYIACRIYGVHSTLPYFIPTPPMIGPAGTFGAFIKIQSPMPSRRAVFDIGVAGPIAGFIALIPVAVMGFLTMKTAPGVTAEQALQGGGLYFADPLFFKLMGLVSGVDLKTVMEPNPFYFAAWVGLLVTALNLIPSGQLDGGHAMYAIFGKRVHYWTGRIAFVTMAAFSILGWFLYGSPSGFLITILLGVMMRVRHPEPLDHEPLDPKRKAVAVITLLIFILCFAPFPIQMS